MKNVNSYKTFLTIAIFFAAFGQNYVLAQTVGKPTFSKDLNIEVKEFFHREVSVHFGDIKTLNPPPDKVNGSITTGEYTWGSFMRVLAAQSDVSGSSKIGGKDTARAIAEMGLYEVKKGGKAFSQLYAAQALRHFGKDLSKNAVWQSMNEDERKEWVKLLDATRIYDPKTREVINLPENYLGVAARIAAFAYEFGLMKDKAFLDSLLERAAKQFIDGAIYADDDLPNGRYDRYSNEYIRFCWKAAEVVGRKDILEKLKTSIKIQMRLWWDLVSDQGYGYNWGRSQGLVSYLDTLEIVAFLGENPEFRPVPLADLASLYNLAWRWIRGGYINERHTFNIFAYGRGNYAYISPVREFQQISTSFAKIIVAHDSFNKVLQAEKLIEIPVKPKLDNVARFEFFDKDNSRKEGVWLVRQGNLKFALPITVGTKPAIADYLAAPFGLSGFANPVEEVYPSLVPFFELKDGKTYAASDGADRIVPAKNGQSLQVVWNKFAKIGSKSGEIFDIGVKSEVNWQIVGNKLIREETLTSDKNITLKNWKFAFPSTATKHQVEMMKNKRLDIFKGEEGTLKTNAEADWKFNNEILATGDTRLSKGVIRPIPLHQILTAETIELKARKPQKWRFEVTVIKN